MIEAIIKNEEKMKKILLPPKPYLFIALVVPLFLGGCNTMEGLGTDIEHAGQALEKSAERNKEPSRPCPCCHR